VWAAAEIYSEIGGERRAELPRYDVAVMEANTELGDNVLTELKKRDSIS